MPIAYNEINKNSFGGTELQIRELEKQVPTELLEKVQIIPSRLRELDHSKHRIFYCHDLPGDPESDHLKNGGYNNFHKLVFVSHWQKQQYINYYGIPHSKCVVLQNSIHPITTNFSKFDKPDKIKLIYHSTPHRGLNILLPVFKKLKEEYSNIELNVFSSFKLYGWEQRDDEESIKRILDDVKSTNGIIYHGFKSNDEVRAELAQSHIFAFPSIWPETSCICLMEAMSAGLICVHSDYAALFETAANWTAMYSYHEDMEVHANMFYHMMKPSVELIHSNNAHLLLNKLKGQKSYTDLYYSRDIRKMQWINLLSAVISEPLEINTGPTKFVYSSGI